MNPNSILESDERPALPRGTRLESGEISYEITSRLGYGGTSITYLAREYRPTEFGAEYGKTVVVKEIFSKQRWERGELYRGEDGISVLMKNEANREEYMESIYRLMRNEKEMANRFATVYDARGVANNRVNAFFIDRILSSREAFPGLRTNSVALYQISDTFEGKTFSELAHKAAEERDLEKIIAYAIKILKTLSSFHQTGYLHLDLKDDNIFFSDDGSVCVIIDFASSVKKEEISGLKIEEDSEKLVSRSCFSASELSDLIQLKAQYRTLLKGDRVRSLYRCRADFIQSAYDKLCDRIDETSDLCSVGKMLCHYFHGLIFYQKKLRFDDNGSLSEICLEETAVDQDGMVNNWAFSGSNAMDVCKHRLIRFFEKASNDDVGVRYKSCDEMIRELEIISNILHKKGFVPEVLEYYSRENYDHEMSVFEDTGIVLEADLLGECKIVE